jgi:hypothetical protein
MSMNESALKMQMIKESQRLLGKYNQYVAPLKESFARKNKVLDEMVLCTVLGCLENHAERMRSVTENTSTANVGTFIQHGYDLIVAVYPNLVLNQIASIQPLNNRNGEIWYYSIQADKTKGGVTSGDKLLDSKIGNRANMRYSSEMIPVVVSGTINGSNATFTGTVAVPVRTNAGTDGVLVTDGVENFVLNAAGTALVGSQGGTGTIDTGSGAVSVTFNTAPVAGSTVVMMYKATFESTPSAIGKTKLVLTNEPISAQKHALTTDYTLDAEYDIQRNFNMNLSEELVKGTAALIRAEIDQLGMWEIRNAASQPGVGASTSNTWSGTVPSGIPQIDHFRTLLTMFRKQSNDIYGATRLVHGNFAIIGTNIATALEILPEFKHNPSIGSENQNSGPYVSGTVAGLTIIKNPEFGANEWVIGNKGMGTFNTGYILAPYRGLMVTPPISDTDNVFSVTRGMYLEAGRKVTNGKFFSYGKATNLTF